MPSQNKRREMKMKIYPPQDMMNTTETDPGQLILRTFQNQAWANETVGMAFLENPFTRKRFYFRRFRLSLNASAGNAETSLFPPR
ncbi:Hypothetical predicted protein [Podarcis lilfordi]|nr:Hypothetical predicted protein [Podarcis lilfordi]